MTQSKEKYITLKEAAELSGYAPDYVGQLIRAGKIEGKQVYSNVAWVTTEEAVNNYVNQKKRGSSGNVDATPHSFVGRFFDGAKIDRFIRASLYALIGAGVLFGLFLFYILSINIEHYLESRAAVKADERAKTVSPPQDEVPQLPL